jgi:hypothetical protein
VVQSLGSATATGVISPPFASQNSGQWTVTFDPPAIGVTVGEFECYHIVISGPPGSSFQIYVGSNFYDYVTPGDINSWDPHQPMLLNQGDTVYFYWLTATGSAPVVTMYFRTRTLL